MRHSIFSLLPIMPPPSSSTTTTKPRKPTSSSTTTTTTNHHNNHHSATSSLLCRHHSHSPSTTATATLDLLILILVLFSGTFLLTSYFSYIFNSLSLLLPPLSLSLSLSIPPLPFPHPHPPFVYFLGFVVSFAVIALLFDACCCGGGNGLSSSLFRSRRRCGNPKCKGLKKAMEFDLQLQSEDSLKSGGNSEIERLPWKGGNESNPDYECLRAELRKMAPVNGRAVLLFRSKCGCPVAKLVGWGPKKGRKHKNIPAHERGRKGNAAKR